MGMIGAPLHSPHNEPQHQRRSEDTLCGIVLRYGPLVHKKPGYLIVGLPHTAVQESLDISITMSAI